VKIIIIIIIIIITKIIIINLYLKDVSRALDFQLGYQRSNQDYIMGVERNAENHMDEDREESTSSTFLSDSVTGSPRHRKKLACNALAVAAEIGKPHCFTTMTANVNWPEIQEMLLPGQTAFDRMEIVCRVFNARKNALIHNLKHGHYFDGKCAFILHVIEYQHRGLPHVHIVYRLENGPDHSDKEACVEFIDKYISAKKPNPNDIEYLQKVEKCMIHKCSNNQHNGCLKNDICQKGFSPIPIPTTYFDERSYPIYAKPYEEDCYVVAHNKQMLIDSDCHINTEFCASNYSLIYLYKYLFKGIYHK
jgi:hypothetical protein